MNRPYKACVAAWLVLVGASLWGQDLASGDDCNYALRQLLPREWLTLRTKNGEEYTGMSLGISDGYFELERSGKPVRLKLDDIDEKSLPIRLRRPSSVIADITDPEKRKFAQTLFDQMQNQSKRVPGQIPSPLGSSVDYGSSSVLIAPDPILDPALYRWLANTQNKFEKVSDPTAKSKAIAKHVAQTFKYETGGLLHPIRRRKHQNLTDKTQWVRLGDFIENRTGTCRQRSLALQLALQKAGLPSRFSTGEMSVTYKSDGVEFEPKTLHAWVVIPNGRGGEIILDPMQGIYRETANATSYEQPEYGSTEERQVEGREFGAKVVTHYQPFRYSATSYPDAADLHEFVDFLSIAIPGIDE